MCKIIFLYIVLWLHIINAYDSTKKFISKDDVLAIKYSYNDHIYYYCKDNICVDSKEYETYIYLPDNSGNITQYIVPTCDNNSDELNKCPDRDCITGECISIQNNDDSECLSNKCMGNFCIFNDKPQIVRCDNIYEQYYYHCGKMPFFKCKANDECSSMKCINNKCQNPFRKAGGDNGGGLIVAFIVPILVIILILIC